MAADDESASSYQPFGMTTPPRFQPSPVAFVGALASFATLLAILLFSAHEPLGGAEA